MRYFNVKGELRKPKLALPVITGFVPVVSLFHSLCPLQDLEEKAKSLGIEDVRKYLDQTLYKGECVISQVGNVIWIETVKAVLVYSPDCSHIVDILPPDLHARVSERKRGSSR